MVTGINSDIEYNGKIYHVQTEDGGLENPVILTRIFCSGALIKTKKTSYLYMLEIDGLKDVVGRLMKEQHNDMVQDIYKGNCRDK